MKVNSRHRKAIELLVYTDMTHEEISQEIGITRKSLYNWRKDEDFQAAYNEELEKKAQTVRDAFKKDSDRVYAELLRIINSDDAQDRDKITVAKYILDHAVGKSAETINMESKVEVTDVSEKDILKAFDK